MVNETAGLFRYADFEYFQKNGKNLLYSICEDHTIDEPSRVVNTLVCFPVSDGGNNSPISSTPQSHHILVNASRDPELMFSSPRVDPSGRYIAWIEWRHPNMPWDDTFLFVAQLSEDGTHLISEPVCVAGGTGESVMEPVWQRDSSGYAWHAYQCLHTIIANKLLNNIITLSLIFVIQ